MIDSFRSSGGLFTSRDNNRDVSLFTYDSRSQENAKKIYSLLATSAANIEEFVRTNLCPSDPVKIVTFPHQQPDGSDYRVAFGIDTSRSVTPGPIPGVLAKAANLLLPILFSQYSDSKIKTLADATQTNYSTILTPILALSNGSEFVGDNVGLNRDLNSMHLFYRGQEVYRLTTRTILSPAEPYLEQAKISGYADATVRYLDAFAKPDADGKKLSIADVTEPLEEIEDGKFFWKDEKYILDDDISAFCRNLTSVVNATTINMDSSDVLPIYLVFRGALEGFVDINEDNRIAWFWTCLTKNRVDRLAELRKINTDWNAVYVAQQEVTARLERQERERAQQAEDEAAAAQDEALGDGFSVNELSSVLGRIGTLLKAKNPDREFREQDLYSHLDVGAVIDGGAAFTTSSGAGGRQALEEIFDQLSGPASVNHFGCYVFTDKDRDSNRYRGVTLFVDLGRSVPEEEPDFAASDDAGDGEEAQADRSQLHAVIFRFNRASVGEGTALRISDIRFQNPDALTCGAAKQVHLSKACGANDDFEPWEQDACKAALENG
ncbi:hypothetical protein [Cucumibacter marinus]|uniref:hypothetical protein n=1 Tax=Cucumibacter marinus TaxID=1121252 RepID=UPI00138AC0EF|nr:hypothetical protein [Cucumibacter marinus]